jgi:L-proline amide hydrolase
MTVSPTASGRIPFGEYRTWYRSTGELSPSRPALVLIHGGPGSTHDYLRRLSELSDTGWTIVHYDQLGNGGSTHLPDADADFWTVELFLDELDNLLRSLGIAENYALFGHSWGGMLAARHAADNPAGLRGLVISNAPASYPLWLQEMQRLRAELPAEVEQTLRRHEAACSTDSAEYADASRIFMEKHVCRRLPWPRDYLATHYEVVNDPTVYLAMNGPSEFHVIGSLKDWSVSDYCPKIAVPALVISGRYDEATPATVQPFVDLIPDVRWELFDESSHTPFCEQEEHFDQVMRQFLTSLPGR